jgi:signal transduction histidine kinase
VAPFHLGQRVIGSIRVKASLAEVERLANIQAQRALLLALLSVLGIAGVLGVILTRTIARPVGLLVDAMNAARAGRLDTRVQLRGSDELQQLGDHFNSMLETISRADHEKRELVDRLSRFNDELESRVAAATADIAAKNLELQHINEQLWHVQKQLGRAERLAALGQMTAAIAHELGTPLNSVLGYTQLLAKEVTSPDGREKLSIIESQVRIMSQAIRNALDQTRTPSVERRSVAVADLIEETLALLAPALGAKGIAVDRRLDDAPAVIAADSRGLQQIPVFGCASQMTARASRRAIWSTSFSPSLRPRRSAAAPAWASRSPRTSRGLMEAQSASRAVWAVGRRSTSRSGAGAPRDTETTRNR